MMNRCELTVIDALQDGCVKKPSVEELRIDADFFYNTHSLNGTRFRKGFLQDCGCHMIYKPADDDMQETLYTRCKRMHALKTSACCAVKRKWIYEVATFAGRANDLGAWAETTFAKSITV